MNLSQTRPLRRLIQSAIGDQLALRAPSLSRTTVWRLGRDRPVSRNDRCRAVEPICTASASGLNGW